MTQVVLPGADGGSQVGQAAPPAQRGPGGCVTGGGGHLNLPLCQTQGGAIWSCIAAVWTERRRDRRAESLSKRFKVSVSNTGDALETNLQDFTCQYRTFKNIDKQHDTQYHITKKKKKNSQSIHSNSVYVYLRRTVLLLVSDSVGLKRRLGVHVSWFKHNYLYYTSV